MSDPKCSKRGERVTLESNPAYRCWAAMKQRCCCKTSPNYPQYGGRGIQLCERWSQSFAAFIADMGPRPGPEYSIDRINNDGNYEPGNCRWATRAEQQRNKRNNRWFEHDGKRMVLVDWAKELGLNMKTLQERLKTMDLETALTTPKMSGRRRAA